MKHNPVLCRFHKVLFLCERGLGEWRHILAYKETKHTVPSRRPYDNLFQNDCICCCSRPRGRSRGPSGTLSLSFVFDVKPNTAYIERFTLQEEAIPSPKKLHALFCRQLIYEATFTKLRVPTSNSPSDAHLQCQFALVLLLSLHHVLVPKPAIRCQKKQIKLHGLYAQQLGTCNSEDLDRPFVVG